MGEGQAPQRASGTSVPASAGAEAIEEAADEYRHAKKYGVPVGLVVMLLFGLYQFLNLQNEVNIVKEKDIPAIRKEVEAVKEYAETIGKKVGQIERGDTTYQKWQAENLSSASSHRPRVRFAERRRGGLT